MTFHKRVDSGTSAMNILFFLRACGLSCSKCGDDVQRLMSTISNLLFVADTERKRLDVPRDPWLMCVCGRYWSGPRLRRIAAEGERSHVEENQEVRQAEGQGRGR